jgi:hypothetical protein
MSPQARFRSLVAGLHAGNRSPATHERAGARSVPAHPPEGDVRQRPGRAASVAGNLVAWLAGCA